MARPAKISGDPAVLQAALEGFELQKKRIDEQISQIRAMLGKRKSGSNGTAEVEQTGRKQLSGAARKRIAAAQTKRWAEFRKNHPEGKEKK